MLGAIKIGAIAGPLFEAFMEGAVKDRLENSEAKVVVTTPEPLERIPADKLPHLQHIFVVGGEAESGTNIINYDEASKAGEHKTGYRMDGQKDGYLLHYTSGSTGTPRVCFMSMKR